MPNKTPTLQSAIRTVLAEQPGFAASTQFISEEIERRDLYTRKDGDRAPAWQVLRRAEKYAERFRIHGDRVTLVPRQAKA